jgi:hypothetical protein
VTLFVSFLCARLCCEQEVLFGLVGVYQSTSTENVKATAASTLARLLRSNPSLLQPLLEHCGPHLLLRGRPTALPGFWEAEQRLPLHVDA